jgi:16S rRNA (guanine527-N7)-methyltransferase
VGSGAGLPGIPLALALREYPFTLIEKMGRRASFLRYALALLGLPNTAVEEAPLEKAAPRRFSLVTFRALRSLEPALLKALFRLLEPEGALAAYKGRRAVIDGELRPLEALCTWEIIPLTVPFLDEERHLVVIRPGGSG